MRDLLFTAAFAIALTIVTFYVPSVLDPFIADAFQTFIQEEQIETRLNLVEAIDEKVSEGRVLEIVNTSNLTILVGLFALTLGTYSFLVQLAIERFFILKLPQKPNYFQAARRSLVISLVFIFYIVYRLFALDDYILIASLGLLIIAELLITQALIGRKQE